MRRSQLLALLFALIALAGCARTHEAREARTTYNAALDLRENEHWDAAVRGFTEARAEAGVDDELRFRAAFELGNTLVAWADVASAEGDAESAAGRLRQAVAWFGDAARLRPDDESVRNNLEVAVTRLRQMGDKLTEGERSLAARLDRALADQRRLRDQLRQLDAAIAAGAIEPAGVESAAVALETAQRTLNADIGVAGDLAAGERRTIEDIPEKERTDPQRARQAQLAALIGHLDRARGAGGDVRSAVRRQLVSRAVDRSEAAVTSLVRAREQLLDPGQLIRGLLADQGLLSRETRVIAALRSGAIELSDEAAGSPEPPPHLSPERLAARQGQLGERAGELAARLGAVIAASEQPEDDSRELLAKATPFVKAAVAAMGQAGEQLGAGGIDDAVERQGEALINLARALEYFADVRGLVELTWAEQKKLIENLTGAGSRDAITESLTLNRERLERLSILFARERQAAETEAGDDEEAKKAIAARFETAERHRAAALEALAGVEKAGLEPARRALDEIEALRRLFFSIVEHLKDLHRRQSATRDRTAEAQNTPDAERAPVLGEIASAQSEHLALGSQLAEALAVQADQAAKQQGQADAGERLAAAADEVRQGSARMESAATRLADAGSNAATESVDLEPPLEDQAAAIEHLARAIAILEPPKEDQQKKDQKEQEQKEQQDQQQPQQQDQPQPSQQELSQSEVDRRLRAIRERETERRRRREGSERIDVEKDW